MKQENSYQLDFCKNKEDLMTARIMRLACDDNGINAVSYRI